MHATVATGVGALLLLVPGLNVILFIALMLPLWVLSNMGIPSLGHPLHGFFVPSAVGWCLAASVAWLVSFALSLGAQSRVSDAHVERQ